MALEKLCSLEEQLEVMASEGTSSPRTEESELRTALQEKEETIQQLNERVSDTVLHNDRLRSPLHWDAKHCSGTALATGQTPEFLTRNCSHRLVSVLASHTNGIFLQYTCRV